MEGSLHPEQLALVFGSDHRQLLVGKRIGACRLWSTDLLDCRSWSVSAPCLAPSDTMKEGFPCEISAAQLQTTLAPRLGTGSWAMVAGMD